MYILDNLADNRTVNLDFWKFWYNFGTDTDFDPTTSH